MSRLTQNTGRSFWRRVFPGTGINKQKPNIQNKPRI